MVRRARELAARSRFVEEIDELLPADIEKLQDVDTVTVIRAEARTAQVRKLPLKVSVLFLYHLLTSERTVRGRPSTTGCPRT